MMVNRETFLTLLLCCCCGFQSCLLHIVNKFTVFINLEKKVLIFNSRQSPHDTKKTDAYMNLVISKGSLGLTVVFQPHEADSPGYFAMVTYAAQQTCS